MTGRRVRLTAAANRHLNSKRAWWIKNRDQREVFARELERAFEILAFQPGIGQRHPSTRFPALRRFLLRKTSCHVYYTYDEKTVTVHALGGARRGRGPLI